MTNVFLANFERGSEVVDLYQYITKCLKLLNASERDECANDSVGVHVVSKILMLNVIECTKNIIDEYYGINLMPKL